MSTAKTWCSECPDEHNEFPVDLEVPSLRRDPHVRAWVFFHGLIAYHVGPDTPDTLALLPMSSSHATHRGHRGGSACLPSTVSSRKHKACAADRLPITVIPDTGRPLFPEPAKLPRRGDLVDRVR